MLIGWDLEEPVVVFRGTDYDDLNDDEVELGSGNYRPVRMTREQALALADLLR